MNRLEKLPVPILPTFVGALTLSNVYAGFGYSWLRHFMMWTAAVILICYIVKLVRFPKTCLEEYKAVVPGSLYAGFSMVTMILGSYFFELGFSGGKFIWGAGLVIHSVHILVFTVRNILMKRDINTFVPSWFVTYNGIMVSCVTGAAMNAGKVLTVVTYYGIAVYVLLIPFMIWRLMKVEVKPAVYHTMAVLLAPCSLCVVSVLNILEKPQPFTSHPPLSLRTCLSAVYYHQAACVFFISLCPGICRNDLPHGDRNRGIFKNGSVSHRRRAGGSR